MSTGSGGAAISGRRQLPGSQRRDAGQRAERVGAARRHERGEVDFLKCEALNRFWRGSWLFPGSMFLSCLPRIRSWWRGIWRSRSRWATRSRGAPTRRLPSFSQQELTSPKGCSQRSPPASATCAPCAASWPSGLRDRTLTSHCCWAWPVSSTLRIHVHSGP